MVIGYPKRLRYHGGGVRYHGGGYWARGPNTREGFPR